MTLRVVDGGRLVTEHGRGIFIGALSEANVSFTRVVEDDTYFVLAAPVDTVLRPEKVGHPIDVFTSSKDTESVPLASVHRRNGRTHVVTHDMGREPTTDIDVIHRSYRALAEALSSSSLSAWSMKTVGPHAKKTVGITLVPFGFAHGTLTFAAAFACFLQHRDALPVARVHVVANGDDARAARDALAAL